MTRDDLAQSLNGLRVRGQASEQLPAALAQVAAAEQLGVAFADGDGLPHLGGALTSGVRAAEELLRVRVRRTETGYFEVWLDEEPQRPVAEFEIHTADGSVHSRGIVFGVTPAEVAAAEACMAEPRSYCFFN